MKHAKYVARALVALGALALALAAGLTACNLWETRQAGQTAQDVLAAIEAASAQSASAQAAAAHTTKSAELTAVPLAAADDPTITSAKVTPSTVTPSAKTDASVKVNGEQYIGVLELPTLGLKLPVNKELSTSRLKLTPCRYQGSAAGKDLIISAHNYATHFGTLNKLKVGDKVYFTDANNVRYTYKVTKLEELAATDVEKMTQGDWDMTLFTCTVGGQSRVTVRLKQTAKTTATSTTGTTGTTAAAKSTAAAKV
jgi:sortase A